MQLVFNSASFYRSACTKPGKWTVVYLCVRGIVVYLCIRGIVVYFCVKGIIVYLCIRSIVMYFCVKGIVMYLCVRGIVVYLCVKGIVVYLCVKGIILILIGQLQNIFKSKQPRSSIVFGCSVKWPDWNVTILFHFFPKMFEMTTERVFHTNVKYVLRLLNVVIHELQFKRKGKYYKFHFDKEAYTKPKNVRIIMF